MLADTSSLVSWVTRVIQYHLNPVVSNFKPCVENQDEAVLESREAIRLCKGGMVDLTPDLTPIGS